MVIHTFVNKVLLPTIIALEQTCPHQRCMRTTDRTKGLQRNNLLTVYDNYLGLAETKKTQALLSLLGRATVSAPLSTLSMVAVTPSPPLRTGMTVPQQEAQKKDKLAWRRK
jgi:hypothetical protein